MINSAAVDKLKQYPFALVVFVIWIIIVVVVFVRSDIVGDLEAEEAKLSTRLQLIKANAIKSKGVEEHAEALESNVEAIKKRLLVHEYAGINTNFLYSYQERHDISIDEVKLLSTENTVHGAGGPHELKINSATTYGVSLAAEYTQLLEYLYALYQEESAFIRVSSFEIKGAPANGLKSDKLEVNLSLLVLSEKK